MIFLARNRDGVIVATAKHRGVIGDFSAALSSSVSGSERKSGWVASAARPWAAATGSATVTSADTVIPSIIVFQAWVKCVWSESFVKNVQYKEGFYSARPDRTVIALVSIFTVDLYLFGNGSDDSDGIVFVCEWIASVVVFIGSIHHNASITVMKNSTVFIHVILSFTGTFSVIILKVTPASIIPDGR